MDPTLTAIILCCIPVAASVIVVLDDRVSQKAMKK